METTLVSQEIESPFFSLVIPLSNDPTAIHQNKLTFEKIKQKALAEIIENCDKKESDKLSDRLNKIAEKINLEKPQKGIGIFLTLFSERVIEIPFEVKERINISNHFILKDVLYLDELNLNYILLDLNSKKITLFEGHGKTLTPIQDAHLPYYITNDYEYAKPSISKSYGYGLQNTEEDSSKLKMKHFVTAVKTVDKLLHFYFINKLPFFISGGDKELGYFKKNTKHITLISGEIRGNFVHLNEKERGEIMEAYLKNYLNSEEDKLINRLDDAIGKKLGTYGVESVWEDIKADKGLILLVERNLEIQAFEVTNEQKIYLKQPKTEFDLISDAVDDCITTIISKGGKVIIFEEDKLIKFNRIALIKRFS